MIFDICFCVRQKCLKFSFTLFFNAVSWINTFLFSDGWVIIKKAKKISCSTLNFTTFVCCTPRREPNRCKAGCKSAAEAVLPTFWKSRASAVRGRVCRRSLKREQQSRLERTRQWRPKVLDKNPAGFPGTKPVSISCALPIVEEEKRWLVAQERRVNRI